MLYRAYNLCDPGEERQEEIDLLKYAFINQNFPRKEVIKTIQSGLWKIMREPKKGQNQL